MFRAYSLLSLAAALTASVVTIAQGPAPAAQASAEPPPYWAYGVPPPAAPAPDGAGASSRTGGAAAGKPRPPQDMSPKHIPDSTEAFTIPQLRDFFNVADWFPGDHPPMPDVVVHGRAPDVRGCGDVPYAERAGPARKRADRRPPLRLRRSAALRLQERSANQRRAAQDQHRADDPGGEGDDGRRNQGRRDLPVVAQVEAMDQGGRGRHRAAHAAVRQRVLRHRRRRDRAAWASASSKRRSTIRGSSCAIRIRALPPTSRPAASRKGAAIVSSGGQQDASVR